MINFFLFTEQEYAGGTTPSDFNWANNGLHATHAYEELGFPN